MISLVDFQAAVIELLKSDGTVTGSVGVEVREDNWQATNFVYPCVRVTGPTIGSTIGTCTNAVSFEVYTFSNEPSSKGCALLTDIVIKALEEKTLHSTHLNTSRIYITRVLSPKRASVNTWRATIECSTIATGV